MLVPMVPWQQIDSAVVPGGRDEMVLLRRGDEYVIRVGGFELMNSRAFGSEQALAKMACAQIAARPGPIVLIGGLGMGFTAAAALKQLGPDARVVVAEIVPAVVEWNRGPLAHLAGDPLQDRRVAVQVADVAELLTCDANTFDAVMLDVDNGPQGLSRAANDWLYTPAGLKAAGTALRPGGVLAVWSAAPSTDFTRRLARAGFEVVTIPVRARGARKGSRHIIWIAVTGSG
jgi:spermidine synthase